MKYIKLSLFIFILSCGTTIENKTTPVDPQALRLNKMAVEFASTQNEDSIRLAIELLDSAIRIQPDHFYSHYSKLIYQNELGLKIEAAETAQIVSELKPKNPVLLMNSGLLKEIIGDTSLTMEKYSKSKNIFENILDTIQKNTDSFKMFQFYYAVDLKLLRQTELSDSIFNVICHDSTPVFNYYTQKAKKYIGLTREEMIIDYNENE